jgi:hypothetical protein
MLTKDLNIDRDRRNPCETIMINIRDSPEIIEHILTKDLDYDRHNVYREMSLMAPAVVEQHNLHDSRSHYHDDEA